MSLSQLLFFFFLLFLQNCAKLDCLSIQNEHNEDRCKIHDQVDEHLERDVSELVLEELLVVVDIKYAVDTSNDVNQSNEKKAFLEIIFVLRLLQVHLFGEGLIHEEEASPDCKSTDSHGNSEEPSNIFDQISPFNIVRISSIQIYVQVVDDDYVEDKCG